MQPVKLLKQMLVALFLAMWLPAANHCYLEMAGLIPSDECCTPQESAPTKSDPCDTGCKLVEKAGYKTETYQKVCVVVPMLISICKNPIEQRPNISRIEIQFWPSETLRLPQFRIATALPIRGPSFAS